MNSRDLFARIQGELGSTPSARVPSDLESPPRVADHELIRRIGAGSYGEVWLARSLTGQWRAVKIVARTRFENERPYEREFRGVVQFEPISRTHSGLIQVLHVGRDDVAGAFYYVMELADAAEDPRAPPRLPGEGWAVVPASGAGAEAFAREYQPRTLRSELDARGRLPVLEAVALGVQLSGALGHIHRRGLVHRDVKPSNVIFVHGLPKLADLGLVATTHEARSFVGTEGFIPPEGPGTVRADLFALGRLLYEVSTGRDRCAFPEIPPDLDAWPDRDVFLELNEVMARLCAPEASRRFANAAEVAGDLNLILAGRSVRRAYGVERRLRRATRFSALALVVLALFGGVVAVQELRQRQAEARAAEERTLRHRAEAAETASRQQLYTALLEQARATVRSGELGQRARALEAIRRAAALRNTPELRREAVAAFGLPDLVFRRTLPYGGQYTVRQFDPTFERVAVGQGRGPVEIRSVVGDRLMVSLTPSTNLMCYNASWSPEGRFLSVKRDHDHLGLGADLEVWDFLRDATLRLIVHQARRNVRVFHPALPRLLTCDRDGYLVTWDLETGSTVSRHLFLEPDPEYAAFTPDGERLAVLHLRASSAVVSVHRAADAELLSVHPFSSRLVALAWDPAGKSLAVTDLRGSVHLVDPDARVRHTLGRHRAEAVTAAFHPGGQYLITGGWERSLICWDLHTRQRAFVVELDSYHLQFRSDGLQCALMTPDGMEIRDFELPAPRQFPEDMGSRLRLAAFSPEGRWLAAAADERLGVWDLLNPGPGVLVEEGAEGKPYWAPGGQELFASRWDETAFHWRVHPAVRPGEAPTLERRDLSLPPGFIWLGLASNHLAWTTTRGSQVVSWDQPDPVEQAWKPTIQGMNALSPDGRWLGIYRGFTSSLFIYQRPELNLVAQLKCRSSISGFHFSPASDELAVASRGQVEFWSTRDWKPTRLLAPFSGIPHVGILVQPDGLGWWMAREQRFACLHDPDSLEPRLPLPSALSPLAVSADGRYLAVAVEARRLEVWDLALVRSQLRELGLDWDSPASSEPSPVP